ncbi:MAG TPA: hypothetical protein VJM33_10785 [Microthrixaceae bacterium]|nr:hypothetical protein [Microthrixaceae bacterium]
MKRALLLLALPLGLLFVWAAQNAGSRDAAVVEIDAHDPAQLRGAVLSRLGLFGAVRIGEKSSFTGSGSSELRFRIPTARLEEAMVALDSLGGNVTSQEVDLGETTDRASSVESGVDNLGGCLDDVDAALSSGIDAARARLAFCQASADEVGREIDGASVDVDESELDVRIHPIGGSNPVLMFAVALLLIAAVGLSVMVWRSTRERSDVDLRDIEEFESYDDDPFLRRN